MYIYQTKVGVRTRVDRDVRERECVFVQCVNKRHRIYTYTRPLLTRAPRSNPIPSFSATVRTYTHASEHVWRMCTRWQWHRCTSSTRLPLLVHELHVLTATFFLGFFPRDACMDQDSQTTIDLWHFITCQGRWAGHAVVIVCLLLPPGRPHRIVDRRSATSVERTYVRIAIAIGLCQYQKYGAWNTGLPPRSRVRFWLSDILFDHSSYLKFYINIIYFIMTYFIIKDILILIYLFYNLYKIFE